MNDQTFEALKEIFETIKKSSIKVKKIADSLPAGEDEPLNNFIKEFVTEYIQFSNRADVIGYAYVTECKARDRDCDYAIEFFESLSNGTEKTEK